MITLVSGTNRPASVTRQVVDIYKSMLERRSVASEIIDLVDLPSDFISSALYDNSGKNVAFQPMQNQMLQADKYVFFVPEYNGSFPGILKTFIDGLSYPDTFKGKKNFLRAFLLSLKTLFRLATMLKLKKLVE